MASRKEQGQQRQSQADQLAAEIDLRSEARNTDADQSQEALEPLTWLPRRAENWGDLSQRNN